MLVYQVSEAGAESGCTAPPECGAFCDGRQLGRRRVSLLEITIFLGLVFIAGMSLLIGASSRRSRVISRLSFLEGQPESSPVLVKARNPLDLVSAFGNSLGKSKFMPARTMAELERSLTAAGFRGKGAVSLFLGSKVTLLVLLHLVAAVVLRGRVSSTMVFYAAIAGSLVIGLLLPDLIVGRLRARYLSAVEAGLPDALDMMVICAEAGLALEAAVERVATEIESAHPSVASELKLTANEMRITTDRRIALTSMGLRTDLASLRRLGGTLIQTMQYGTPLGHALRILSVELRQETLTRFEEKAARLPVLLTLPMILFILPCVFIVVGGPAGIQISRQLMH